MKLQQILGAGAIAITSAGCLERDDEYPQTAPVTVYDQPNGFFYGCDVYTDSTEVGALVSNQEVLDLCSNTYEDVVTCLRLDAVDGGTEIQSDLISCLEIYNGARSIDVEYYNNEAVYRYNCTPGVLEDLICR